ncbi:hypothetical protein BU16DRAFT_525432 [Lophium mytilinum]|uniref:DUF7587 domain-containing protein n=1 Tax=Lophium mytilinum TaxID=390894 RepID=A0A6A6R0F5_9PEZI|nr:hypothetical protein BU16DRAFT_525432 [Lophium mytilinum]
MPSHLLPLPALTISVMPVSYHTTSPTTSTATPLSIPSYLYRVDYPGSRTLLTPSGFVAANTTITISSTIALRHHASLHFDWRSRASSPFISLFADRAHAVNWAQAISVLRENVVCYVTQISTAALGPGPIFRAADLLGAAPGGGGCGQHAGEYLVLWQIPIEACVGEVVVRAGEGSAMSWVVE